MPISVNGERPAAHPRIEIDAGSDRVTAQDGGDAEQ